MTNKHIVIGKIGAPHGVKGWVKVNSYTDVLDQIFTFETWLVGTDKAAIAVEEHRKQGNKFVAKLAGCDDRETAQQLTNQDISIPRAELPDLDSEQYYWSDLEGLSVTTTNKVALGKVDEVFSTGANDVLVVEGDKRRLIPFIKTEVIQKVDLNDGTIIVDWDPEF